MEGLSKTVAPFVVLEVGVRLLPEAEAEPEAEEPAEVEDEAATDETVTPAACLQVSAKEDSAVDVSPPEQAL